MPPFVATRSNAEIDAERAASDAALLPAPPAPGLNLDDLSGHLRMLWEKAKRGKQTMETRMAISLRARNGQYEAAKLAAIKAVMGADYDPIFMKITETKCRAAEAWIRDTLFQPGMECWDIRPTPIPELPQEVRDRLAQGALEWVQQAALAYQMQTGIVPPGPAQVKVFEMAMEEGKQRLDAAIKSEAKRAADKMKLLISDQFAEGAWYSQLEMCIYDIVTFGTAILKGPMLKMSPVQIRKMQPDGRYKTIVERRAIPVWERVNPMTFYPSPDATMHSLPWYFHKISMSRKNISDLLGLPGYRDDELRAVLEEHRTGGLREWTTIDSERAYLERKESTTIYDTELIDCLEFGGSVPGSMLLEWGPGLTAAIPDPAKDYEIQAWMIGNHVVKAMLNPDPLGRKYVHSAGFSERPDSFWHIGIPELVEHVQNLANAAARALVMNVGVASGPQVELNTDRLGLGETGTLYPWKVWKTTSMGMMESPAVKFNVVPMVSAQLLEVYDFCLRQADDDTGVPRYAHTGETRGGGAGETASGLSMLMSHAAKGIKNVIKSLDAGIIEPSVEAQYQYNLRYEGKDSEVIGDLRVMARGSSALIAKEQSAVRRNEFLDRTNNPTDLQITGLKGRAYLMRENLEALGIDPDKVVGEEEEIERKVQEIEAQQRQMQMAQAAPPALPPAAGEEEDEEEEAEEKPIGSPGRAPSPRTRETDGAGNPVAGRDEQAFESQEGVKP